MKLLHLCYSCYSSAPNLKQAVRVRLINNQGLDEAGVDGGGLFRYTGVRFDISWQ